MSAPVSLAEPPPALSPTTFAARHERPKYGSFAEPPCPLPPDLRSDVANRRAEGHTWEQVGTALRYDPDALRQACDDDPSYEPVEEKAYVAARRSVEADALQRLRRLMQSENEKIVREAAGLVLTFGSECRKDEGREAAEAARAGTARLKVYAQKPHLWAAGAAVAPRPLPVERDGFASRRGPPPREARTAHAPRGPATDDAPPG